MFGPAQYPSVHGGARYVRRRRHRSRVAMLKLHFGPRGRLRKLAVILGLCLGTVAVAIFVVTATFSSLG